MSAADTRVSLNFQDISMRLDGRSVLQHVTASVEPGELVVLLGPNGAGKTTLLRCAVGLNRPSAGRALIGDRDLRVLPPTTRARLLSYLPQQRTMAWPLLVEDAVALGRFAYGAAPGRLTGDDATAVTRALAACDLTAFARRRTDTLSGGEMARVHFARAFAAQTPLLIADEPVASLDPLHQFQLMMLLKEYVANGGGALVVLHDIPLAARFADRLLWLHDGGIIADGPPDDTLTTDRLREAFGVEGCVEEVPEGGRGVRLIGAASPPAGAR